MFETGQILAGRYAIQRQLSRKSVGIVMDSQLGNFRAGWQKFPLIGNMMASPMI
jgi:hypothetical protein